MKCSLRDLFLNAIFQLSLQLNWDASDSPNTYTCIPAEDPRNIKLYRSAHNLVTLTENLQLHSLCGTRKISPDRKNNDKKDPTISVLRLLK